MVSVRISFEFNSLPVKEVKLHVKQVPGICFMLGVFIKFCSLPCYIYVVMSNIWIFIRPLLEFGISYWPVLFLQIGPNKKICLFRLC